MAEFKCPVINRDHLRKKAIVAVLADVLYTGQI